MPESIKARRARRKRAAVLGVGLFALFQLLCAVGLAALALLALEETQPRALAWGMLRLARSYLRAPGEGALVSRSLSRGLSALGGGQI